MVKNVKTSLTLSALFVGLIRFRPVWERNPGGFWNVLFFLAIVVLFFWLIAKIIIEISRLIKQRNNFTFKLFIPVLVMTFLLLDGMFNPLKINLDAIYGQVELRAWYEGTQNQATFKLRENGKFDIHWTGAFFYDEFFTGNYMKNGDTIVMDFDTEAPPMLDGTVIIKGENLYLLRSDTLMPTNFYLGYCKGLN